MLNNQGKVVSALRPVGIAEIEGREVNAISATGELIEPGVMIEVCEVRGREVLVIRKDCPGIGD